MGTRIIDLYFKKSLTEIGVLVHPTVNAPRLSISCYLIKLNLWFKTFAFRGGNENWLTVIKAGVKKALDYGCN